MFVFKASVISIFAESSVGEPVHRKLQKSFCTRSYDRSQIFFFHYYFYLYKNLFHVGSSIKIDISAENNRNQVGKKKSPSSLKRSAPLTKCDS